MKTIRVIGLVSFVGLFLLIMGCFSAPAAQPPLPPQFYGADTMASRGESEIILNSTNNNGTLRIFLNGVHTHDIRPRDRIKIIVRDGQHTLLVQWASRDDQGRNFTIESEAMQINARSMEYVYSIALPSVASSLMTVGATVRLNQVSTNPLSGRLASRESQGIEGAVIRASEDLMPKIPRRSVVAVLYVSAGDRATSESAMNELEYQFDNSGMFRMVTRTELRTIRSELDYHTSGFVSDESMIQATRGLGAEFLITGNVTGTGTARTLTLRALNVETGEFIMAREPF